MILEVPYFKQEHKLTCGVACLRMCLSFYGKNVTEKELIKNIKVHSYGTYTTDNGLAALNMGFKATVFTTHLRLFGSLKLPFGTKITSEILESIRVSSGDRVAYKSMVIFVEKGGILIWDMPRLSVLEKYLDSKIPCTVNLNTAALNRFWKNWDNGHQIVVNGVDKDNVYVLDPDPWGKNNYPISKEIFLPAWSINSRLASGHTIVLEK